MKLSDIAKIRLFTQQITATEFKKPQEIVGWLGAMQAQDYGMCKWAIGVRLPNSTDKEIEKAIDDGKIIRTHVLRPTWHLVLPEDVRWMLELTAPQIKTLMRSRNKELGLTEAVFAKSNKIIAKALSDGNHLTREELIEKLEKAKIPTQDYRSGHLLLHAELDGIVCSGASKGKQRTYVLLDERIPQTKKLHKEEALAKLAKIYFSSHAPATLKDFAWWSGLSLTAAKQALELVKPDFISETIGEQTYWLPSSFSIPKNKIPTVHLLPAFDEYLISYRDRNASIVLEHQHRTFSSNGIFWPVIVVDGQVVGIWKRTIKKDTVQIGLDYVIPQNKTILKRVEQEAKLLGNFFEKKIEMLKS